MSSKSAEVSGGVIPRRLSIALRITIALGLILFLVFTVSLAILQSILVKHLAEENDKGMRQVVTGIRSMLNAPDAREILVREMHAQQFEPDLVKPFIRIIGPGGATVIQTDGMEKVLPPHLFRVEPGKRLVVDTAKGERFLLREVGLEGNNPFRGRILQVAMDISDEKSLARQFLHHRITIFTVALFVTFSAVAGIVRLGLKPLSEISEAALNITRHHLHTRIDITSLPVELLSLAGSFNTMLGRLEESFSRLSQFSDNLAHELRTPVNNLIMETEIALSRPRSAEEYREVLGSAMEEYERLSCMIERLLFLARADSEAELLSLQEVDVAAELENLCSLYGEMARSEGVDLSAAGEGVFAADPEMFRRALMNLIVNAITYTDRGGRVTICGQMSDDNAMMVTVADSGCGIEAEEIPRLFERFYRVNKTRGRDACGSGLGLPIVKAIMDMHGGEIRIDSIPCRGTRVTLVFPAKRNSKIGA